MKAYALTQEKLTEVVQQKLLDLYAELDPWDEDADLERDAKVIVDAILAAS